MLVMPSGITRLVIDSQPLNAPSSMLVTQSGMTMSVKEVQPSYLLLVDYQYYTL